MESTYDKYYQTQDLFGSPYPELIEFFREHAQRGKLLDLGCGQGRDAVALARLGYSVTGIDNSKVGIDQMTQIAKAENLGLKGKVGDIYTFDRLGEFDIILLDSMFHFAKNDRKKEVGLIQRIVSQMKKGSLMAVCIQDTGNKVGILNEAIDFEEPLERIHNSTFKYTFEDKESGHRSETDYRMIVAEK